MKVDLEKLEAAFSSAQSALWGEIVEREFLMRQAWPDVLAELRAAREVVAAAQSLVIEDPSLVPFNLYNAFLLKDNKEKHLKDKFDRYDETVK